MTWMSKSSGRAGVGRGEPLGDPLMGLLTGAVSRSRGVLVDVEDGFHLAAVFGLHAAQAHDLAGALGVSYPAARISL
jgi:hypothetical protein